MYMIIVKEWFKINRILLKNENDFLDFQILTNCHVKIIGMIYMSFIENVHLH